eukprot:220243_1
MFNSEMNIILPTMFNSKLLTLSNLIKIVFLIFTIGIMFIISYIRQSSISMHQYSQIINTPSPSISTHTNKKPHLLNPSQTHHIQRQHNEHMVRKKHTNKYYVNNPLCKILFPSSIMFLFHHKTGTVLARSLMHVIINYCDIHFKNMDNKHYGEFLGWINFRDSHESQIKLQTNSDKNIKLHFWRDPVLTIVSGFAYHMSCREHWASNKLSVHKLSIMAAFFDFNTD